MTNSNTVSTLFSNGTNLDQFGHMGVTYISEERGELCNTKNNIPTDKHRSTFVKQTDHKALKKQSRQLHTVKATTTGIRWLMFLFSPRVREENTDIHDCPQLYFTVKD